MLLSLEDMVTLLRSSVAIQYKESEIIDDKYLAMTDEEIILFIKWGVSRAFPEVSSLSELEEGSEYPILLLAKVELYHKLAILRSEKVDLGADNNNYIKNSQRFDHYTKLANYALQEYNDWLENESLGANAVSSYNVLLSKRHYSNRNYEYMQTPKVHITIDNILLDSVDFHWSVKGTSHFARYRVYISENPIIDKFKDGAKAEDKVNSDAIKVKSTSNIRDNFHRIDGLKENTEYHIAVFSIERNTVFGCAEITFKTLEPLKDEEDVNVTDLGGEE